MNKERGDVGSEGGGGPGASEGTVDGEPVPDVIVGRVPLPIRRSTGMERIMDQALLDLGLINPVMLRRAGDAGLQLAMGEQTVPPPEQRPQA